MSSQVIEDGLKRNSVGFQKSKKAIAGGAEQAAYVACRMVMVNLKWLSPAVPLAPSGKTLLRSTADSADSALCLQHSLKGSWRKAISPLSGIIRTVLAFSFSIAALPLLNLLRMRFAIGTKVGTSTLFTLAAPTAAMFLAFCEGLKWQFSLALSARSRFHWLSVYHISDCGTTTLV